jgi:hypothetical protein
MMPLARNEEEAKLPMDRTDDASSSPYCLAIE